jgi:hypothetical protein
MYDLVEYFFFNCNVQIEQSEAIGEALTICYSDTVYTNLIAEVGRALQSSSSLKQRHQAILGNFKTMLDCLDISSKELQTAFKEREESRVPFDHYRMKTAEL